MSQYNERTPKRSEPAHLSSHSHLSLEDILVGVDKVDRCTAPRVAVAVHGIESVRRLAIVHRVVHLPEGVGTALDHAAPILQELLARLIECEAGGEGENGMKAVASVVMNRVRSTGGEYARVGQGSIRNIIFQPGQFVCASETERGSYNPQNIYNMRPTDIHYEIADWAIAGNRLNGLGTALWFFNPFSPSCRANFPSNVGTFVMRIGDHCFYNPTAAYYDT